MTASLLLLGGSIRSAGQVAIVPDSGPRVGDSSSSLEHLLAIEYAEARSGAIQTRITIRNVSGQMMSRVGAAASTLATVILRNHNTVAVVTMTVIAAARFGG